MIRLFQLKDKLLIGLIILDSCLVVMAMMTAILFLSQRAVYTNGLESRQSVLLLADQSIEANLTDKGKKAYALFLRIDNPELANHDPMTLQIINQQNQVLEEFKFSGNNVGFGDWIKFRLDKSVSTDQPLRLKLSSATKDPQKALRVFLNSDNQLLIKSYSKESFRMVAKSALGGFVENVSKDGLFMVIYSLVIASFLVKLVIGRFNRVSRNDNAVVGF